MVTKEQFLQFLTHHKGFLAQVDKIEEVFGKGFGDTPLCEEAYWLMDLFMESNFDEVGRDAYYEWLYEERSEQEIDGVTYEFNGADDMWNFLENHRT